MFRPIGRARFVVIADEQSEHAFVWSADDGVWYTSDVMTKAPQKAGGGISTEDLFARLRESLGVDS